MLQNFWQVLMELNEITKRNSDSFTFTIRLSGTCETSATTFRCLTDPEVFLFSQNVIRKLVQIPPVIFIRARSLKVNP